MFKAWRMKPSRKDGWAHGLKKNKLDGVIMRE